MAVYHDEIEIEDFDYDEEEEVYYYPCPCGDKFQITKVGKNFSDPGDPRRLFLKIVIIF